MSGLIMQRLAALRLVLPEPAAPVANYVPFVRSGALVFVSGQLPKRNGALVFTGKLGADISIETGQDAASLCFLNLLAQLGLACSGDLDRVVQVVRLGGFIASAPGFTAHPRVMDGASDLAVEVFGDQGRHARTTVGVACLPGDGCVEVDGVFEIR